MTKDSGSTATSAPPALAPVGLPGAGLLAVLALGWLVAMLWSAEATISAGAGGLAITAAAYSLPGVISAVLVAGAALGLVAVAGLGRRFPALPVERAGLRSAVAFGTGLAVGVAGASTIVVAYGTGTASMVLAGTVAAAGTVGGAIAAVRGQHLVASVVAAALAVFAVGFLLNLFKDPLLSLYGLGDTEASRVSAYGWFAATAAIASGLAAGLVAFGFLRRAERRGEAAQTGDAAPAAGTARTGYSDGGGLRWPAYLAAGAGPGLLLLVAEVITRVGGARVLTLAGEVSDNDRTAQAWLDGSRINYALVVLFVGAIVATIAFGRTLPSRPHTDEADAEG